MKKNNILYKGINVKNIRPKNFHITTENPKRSKHRKNANATDKKPNSSRPLVSLNMVNKKAQTVMCSWKASLNCPLLSSSREPSKPFKIFSYTITLCSTCIYTNQLRYQISCTITVREKVLAQSMYWIDKIEL